MNLHVSPAGSAFVQVQYFPSAHSGISAPQKLQVMDIPMALLPVHLDFLQVNMYSYLLLGFSSAFPAPLLSTLVFAAALLLIISFVFPNNKLSKLLQLAALIILNIPVVMVMANQWQFNLLRGARWLTSCIS